MIALYKAIHVVCSMKWHFVVEAFELDVLNVCNGRFILPIGFLKYIKVQKIYFATFKTNRHMVSLLESFFFSGSDFPFHLPHIHLEMNNHVHNNKCIPQFCQFFVLQSINVCCIQLLATTSSPLLHTFYNLILSIQLQKISNIIFYIYHLKEKKLFP